MKFAGSDWWTSIFFADGRHQYPTKMWQESTSVFKETHNALINKTSYWQLYQASVYHPLNGVSHSFTQQTTNLFSGRLPHYNGPRWGWSLCGNHHHCQVERFRGLADWECQSCQVTVGAIKTKGRGGCLGIYIYIYVYIRWWQLKHLLMFTPKIGKMIQFDEHIFQVGWFNHQPV